MIIETLSDQRTFVYITEVGWFLNTLL